MQLSQYSTTQCVCLSRQACVDVCVCRGGGTLTCCSTVFLVGVRGKVGRENVALDDRAAARGGEE